LLTYALFSRAQFTDDFSDGDFTNNPTWQGNTGEFIVNDDNTLQLNAPEEMGESYLVTSSAFSGSATGRWEFLVTMDFGTSGSNLTKVYLMSDVSDLTGSVDGYYVMIGDTEDEVSLYRQDGSNDQMIIDGADKAIDTDPVMVKVRVTRDASGNWELFRDASGGSSFTSEGTALDNTYTSSSFFGFLCDYTSTRHDLFFFDDILVGEDTTPPSLEEVAVNSSTELALTFSEALDESSAEDINNYSIDGGVSVTDASRNDSDPSLVTLTTSILPSGQERTLTVDGVADEAGNTIDNAQATFTFFDISTATFREVQINEFLSDTDESTDLPDGDFVELFNNTDHFYNLQGWSLSDAIGPSSDFPDFILEPGDFVIVCDEDVAAEYESFGTTIGLSSFPAFNNADDEIILRNGSAVVIDQVTYGNDVADEGITNEQVNPNLICSGDFNFLPSEASIGGTPGAENSVLMIVADNFGPEIEEVRAITADSIRIDFSESLFDNSIAITDFTLSPSTSLESLYLLDEYPQSVFIKTAEPITQNQPVQLTASNISDCAGNNTESTQFTFVLGLSPERDDILLSEILFNPRSGSFDFVEIYNPSSSEYFELRGWQLARIDDDTLDDPTAIAEDGLVIQPNGFIVFTEDPQDLAAQYPMSDPNAFISQDLPSYNNDEGGVLLLNTSGEIAERFDYSEDFHLALLEDEEGVSLERISYTNEVNDPNNWRSASSQAGFATPGRPNSQLLDDITASGQLDIEPKVFLPGNAGTGRDFTTINYQLDQTGQFANITIYDRLGRPVKELANGESLSTSGFFRWDGVTDAGKKARMGHYLVVFELYDGSGNKKIIKDTVVVGRDF